MNYIFLFLLFPFLTACVTSSGQQKESTDDDLLELEYLVRPPLNTSLKAPALFLLHGYGSNEKDLFSLADQIPDNWLVVSVRAPFQISESSYRWYDVKLVNDKITSNFEDEEKSRKSLLSLIDKIISEYSVDQDKIVTAGFSQGANMSLNLVLTEQKKVFAAGCFSGRFMEEIKPLITAKSSLDQKQVFISHGTRDQMLPLKYAEENQSILESMGVNVKLSTDRVGHSISSKHLDDFRVWLKDLTKTN